MPWLSSWDSFISTVDTGSMSAAALQLGCTRAQISKQISELEKIFDTQLLERSTRKLKLTAAGEIFYQHARLTLTALENTQVAMQNLGDEPQGVLRVSATITFGRLYIAPLLPQLTKQYPQLHCELILNDQVLDLVQHNIDVALRLTKTPPEDAIAKKLGRLERIICAAPDYFAHYGIPATPQDLTQHRCFSYLLSDNYQWQLLDKVGNAYCIPIRNALQFNDLTCLYEATLAGHGISILPMYLCAEDLRTHKLQQVLSPYQPQIQFGTHVYACYTPSRARTPKVQAFLSALESIFNPTPRWNKPHD